MHAAERSTASIPQGICTVRAVSTKRFRLTETEFASYVRVPQHSHIKTYIIITIDGAYLSTVGTHTKEFTPWSVSLHAVGVPHSSCYSAKGAKVLYVELPPEQLENFSELAVDPMDTINLQGGLAEWTAKQIYREFNDPDFVSSMALDGLILQLLTLLWRRRTHEPTTIPTWLVRADKIVRRRFTEPLTLEDIAKNVGIHPVHLAREYRRYYGCTIGKHIRKLRIDFCCKQISETQHSLADISLSAGFSDQSHFTVAFKHHIGIAPSQYRQAARGMLRY